MGISVYWDPATGNDANDGLSTLTPRLTFQAAFSLLTHQSDDELVLMSSVTLGDQVSLTINKAGISTDRRLTIRGHMPDGYTRPTVTKLGDGYAFRLFSDPGNSDYVCIKDFILRGDDDGSQGVGVYTAGEGILLRNLDIYGMKRSGIYLSGGSGRNLTDVTVKRCFVHDVDRYAGGPHVQGIYVEYAENITFDECVVDHCGRLDADDSGTIYNHNFYIHSSCANITVKNTISARAAATGIQHRCNEQHSAGNFVLDCPLGITFGHDDYGASYPTVHVSGSATGNAILGATDIASGTPRRGPALSFGYASDLTFDDNIIAHCPTALETAISTNRPSTNVTITNTNVYDWGQLAYGTGGTANPSEPTVTVETPTTTLVPTISDYLTSLGVTPGVDPTDTFMDLALRNKDGAWDNRFTAAAVNAYLRGEDPPPDPEIEGSVPTEPEFTTYPTSPQEGTEGLPFTLTTMGSGASTPDDPLTYTWYKDGSPISGETGRTLTFAALTLSDADVYHCVLTNGYGTATGDPITLTVEASPDGGPPHGTPTPRILPSRMARSILLTNAVRPWKPDRRPLVFASPFGGNWSGGSGNIYGVDANFHSNPATWMATYKTIADACGTPRLMPHMWHGELQGSTYSCNFWHGPPDNRRAWFRTTMASTYAGYSIEPYLGGYIPESRGLSDLLTDGGQAATSEDMLLLAHNFLPLFQLGCTKGFVDAFSTNDTTNFEVLHENLHTHLDNLGAPSRTIGSEPLPVTLNEDGRLDVNTALLAERPYLLLEWNYKLPFDYDERWAVDPETTEVHIIIDGSGFQETNREAVVGYHEGLALDETNGPRYLDRLADAGFIVGTNDSGTNNWVADWIRSRYAPSTTSNL